jgi:TonB family protein
MSQRRKKNSSKVNLTISFVFHGALIAAVFYFAAREGMLGKKMKTIVAEMVREKKPVEPPKPKEEPKVVPQQARTDEPKAVATAPPPQTHVSTAPPEAPPVAAPPAVDVPTLDFSDGAKETVTVSDPKMLYKGLIELALRSRWNRPEDVADETYVAEVELNIDAQGNVIGSKWVRGSGDARWDRSVREAVAATKVINRPPPKGFPGAFLARFDVEMTRSEEVLKVSSIQ